MQQILVTPYDLGTLARELQREKGSFKRYFGGWLGLPRGTLFRYKLIPIIITLSPDPLFT